MASGPPPLREMERFTTITSERFDALLNAYDSIVPKKLEALDRDRYVTIPNHLQERPVADRLLSKEQIVTLVDWKLSHGKFRPTLRSLVQQNDEATIAEITKEAFDSYAISPRDALAAKTALATVTKLRGIGPATASLLLSVCDPETAPFFSDELFRWSMYEDEKGNGWGRDIKYNVKEYLELYDKVRAFRSRYTEDYNRDVSAVAIEKVAYVLGKRIVGDDLGGEDDREGSTKKRKVESYDDRQSGKTKKSKNSTLNAEKPSTKVSKQTAAASEPPRRSARRAKRP